MNFQITNMGGGTLSGTISGSRSWIILNLVSFKSNSVEVNVTVDNSILNKKSGQYTGTVSVLTNGGNLSIPVKV